MSVHTQIKRLTIPQLQAMKGEQKIVSLTSYTAPFARILDEVVDFILVGDSTAMVGYDMPDTLSITVDMMAQHAKAVVSATQRCAVVVDMPFGSFQESPEMAFRHAAKLLRVSGADSVKIEGGEYLAETTRFLVERGIPVLAHIGLMPQYFHTMGGFKAQGLSDEAAERIYQDALAQEAAGAWGIVIEGTAEPLARRISEAVSIPTIGIGASPTCDGQVLVAEDIFNLTHGRIPKFAQQFSDVAAVIREGVTAYATGVREGSFPSLDHCFGVKK